MELENTLRNDSQARINTLRELIREGVASNQEEFCKALKLKKFAVTQSTVSRDLRRIGAIKMVNKDGEIVYRLPEEQTNFLPPVVSQRLGGLLTNIQANENTIVVHTTPGSASLVARHIDNMRTELGVLGTIAGDDTIFVCPAQAKKIPFVIKKIKNEF